MFRRFQSLPAFGIAAVFLAAGTGCIKKQAFLYPLPSPGEEIVVTENIQDLTVSETTSLDILWIMDNSPSMDPYLNLVKQNTALFMKNFLRNKSLRWRMAMLSTDFSDKPIFGFTKETQLNQRSLAPADFFEAAVAGLCPGSNCKGSSIEEAFRPLEKALTNHSDFFKQKGDLAIFIFTDHDEGIEKRRESMFQVKEFAQHFKDEMRRLRGPDAKITLYGMFGAVDLGCDSDADIETDGFSVPYQYGKIPTSPAPSINADSVPLKSPLDPKLNILATVPYPAYSGQPKLTGSFRITQGRYGQFFSQFDHQIYPLCSMDLGENLILATKSLVKKTVNYHSYLPLPHIPDAKTIRVEYDNKDIPGGLADTGGFWYYDPETRAVRFPNLDFVLDRTSQIQVRFNKKPSLK